MKNTTAQMPGKISGFQRILTALSICALVIIGGCTQSTDGLENAAQDPATQEEAKTGKLREAQEIEQTKDETGAKIIREKSSLSGKGTSIRVLVNRSPITNYDIKKRVSFLKLRRIGGNRTQKATEELIEERIKLQEAIKLNTLASDAIVTRAFADFAKRNKMSAKRMEGVLNQAGVTAKHFKEFLRIQISWQRTVGTRLRSNTKEQSQADALFSIRKSGEAKPETREYTLQQIIFVVPKDKRKALLKQRQAEAKSFSQRFTSCADTLGQIKNLRDVALRELGRSLEPELPPRWKDDIINTEVGKTTRIKDTDKGVEFIAVCAVRNVSDDRAAEIISKSKEFESLNSKGNEVATKFLAELRSKATIIYR